MVKILRATWRAARLAGHIGDGFLRAAYLQFRCGKQWHQSERGQATISNWMKELADILGLQIQRSSTPLPMPAMIVANHISWLDIIAIANVRPATFLAKDDVRRWPLLGSLMARCGTRFIRRNSPSAVHKCNQQLCHSLRIRQHVAIFPEGTTGNGENVATFHPALFEAARQAYCPIQPLAIRYRQNGERDSIAPYTGNDLFVLHLWRILARRETCVELQFLPPISSRAHRRQLAEQSRALIASALGRQDEINAAMPVLHPLPHHRRKTAPAREPAILQKTT